jgi:hypothetical protein
MDVTFSPAGTTGPTVADSGPGAARDGADRRLHRRFPTDGAGELLLGPLRFPCAILDISSGGAQLQLSERIAPLSPATLRIVNVGALHCRVVWNKHDRTGIRFLHEPNWVKARVGHLFTTG